MQEEKQYTIFPMAEKNELWDKYYDELLNLLNKLSEEEAEFKFQLDQQPKKIVKLEEIIPPRQNDFWIVAEVDGKLVGCERLYFYEDEEGVTTLFLSNVFVDNEYRGCHLGRLLLEEAIETAKINFVPKIALEVIKNNESAISLYRSLGMEESKVIDDFLEYSGYVI